MTDDSDPSPDTAPRIRKSGVGQTASLGPDELRHEVELLATDSVPKLALDTVRLERREDIGEGMQRIVISGEKSRFCPTYGRTDQHGADDDE